MTAPAAGTRSTTTTTTPPCSGRLLASALELSRPSGHRGPRDVARALFAQDAVGAPPSVLVLDDYHTITNPTLHTGVDRFLVEAPAQLRVVISTRHDPPLMLARLRAQGNLLEIRFDDLRLDHSEVAALLNDRHGHRTRRSPTSAG